MAASGKLHRMTPRKSKKFTMFSLLSQSLLGAWALRHRISFGSGATEMSNIFGLCVRGALAALVTDVRSRNVTNPVELIVVPTTPSSVTSVAQEEGGRCQPSVEASRIAKPCVFRELTKLAVDITGTSDYKVKTKFSQHSPNDFPPVFCSRSFRKVQSSSRLPSH